MGPTTRSSGRDDPLLLGCYEAVQRVADAIDDNTMVVLVVPPDALTPDDGVAAGRGCSDDVPCPGTALVWCDRIDVVECVSFGRWARRLVNRLVVALRPGLERVLAEYPNAVTGTFSGHPLASFVRRELQDLLTTEWWPTPE